MGNFLARDPWKLCLILDDFQKSQLYGNFRGCRLVVMMGCDADADV